MVEETTAQAGIETETDPRLPALTTPERLQYILLHPKDEYQRVNVRLILDEANHYDEHLPVEVVQGLLNPTVADFFILIKGTNPIPRSKGHYLHTSYIRECVLLDNLPGWEIS